MGLLNEEGDRLARRVQRGLVRAGLNDSAIIAVQPGGGRELILRHGLALHRIVVRPHWGHVPVHEMPGWMPLLVAAELADAAVWELADAGMSFLDERGNANLILDGQTVLFARATPRGRSASVGREASAMRPARERSTALSLARASHQVAFALLCAPGLASAPVRKVAEAAQVSLGTAHNTLKELADAGFLSDSRLLRADLLLDEWAEAYQRLTFPLLTPRRLYAEGPAWVERVLRDPSGGVLLGGAAAAEVLTGAVRATDGIAYVRDVGRAVALLRLVPSPTPFRVDIREQFWGDGIPLPRPGVVPAVLVYGDLLRDGDARLASVARNLRELDAHLRALG